MEDRWNYVMIVLAMYLQTRVSKSFMTPLFFMGEALQDAQARRRSTGLRSLQRD